MFGHLKNRLYKRKKDVIVVSGLPRSGTSMVMQMLDAGGFSVVTDGKRKPDRDNPKGYFEYDKVKNLKDDASWVDSCGGSVIKVVSPLLSYLPGHNSYKVIFLLRDMNEVLSSQNEMINRMDTQEEDTDNKDIKAMFSRHLSEIREWLDRQKNFHVLYLQYAEVVSEPAKASEMIRSFLDMQVNTAEMARIVDPHLYRQRVS